MKDSGEKRVPCESHFYGFCKKTVNRTRYRKYCNPNECKFSKKLKNEAINKQNS